MNKIYPQKLKKGDLVRIIAPARSLAIINKETRKIANERFAELGLKLSFGRHVEECDDFASSSIESRIEDFHAAFADKNVKAVFSVIGGFNSNQLLKYLNWDLIKKNPKIFCGFSDITALNNAIFAKTGLVNYSGPAYSTLGKMLDSEYTIDYLKKCLFEEAPIDIRPSKKWDDRKWWENPKDRKYFRNKGWQVINTGQAKGTILGANLCTLNLLQGTEYFPDLTDSILFIEDDYESLPPNFDRDLVSLIEQKNFDKVRGMVIGRFQKASEMTESLMEQIIKSKRELKNIPVIAGVDFGHSDPKITFPIGGEAEISVSKSGSKIIITRH